jgi:hypothetical protein
VPRSLRLTSLNPTEGEKGWRTSTLWNAPADITVPGRSYFAVLRTNEISEGERLVAWAPDGGTLKGVVVPDSAVVLSDDKLWCFVEKPAGTFTAIELAGARSVDAGYAVSSGVAVGDLIVTRGAGLLMARMTNPSTEAE